MANLLKELNINFKNDSTTEWSLDKRYDFIINESCIIETHGEQHKNGRFESAGGRNLRDEIENDRYKRELALSNGIEYYIEIDCAISELEFIKNNILNSELTKLFDLSNVDWELIDRKAQKSLSIEALELWNFGLDNVDLIAERLNVSHVTIRKYLKIWNKAGKCNFDNYDKRLRKIVQLTINYEFISEWDSLADAIRGNSDVNIRQSSISMNLSNKGASAGGFKWMYRDVYNKYLITGVSPHPVFDSFNNCKKIVKLNSDLEYIDEYNSIKEAALMNNIKNSSAISQVLSGKRKISHNFRWMYLEDYKQLMKEQGEC